MQIVKMMFPCGLLLLFLSSVRTGSLNDNKEVNKVFDGRLSYSYWPSIHNAVRVMKIRKREAAEVVQSEGGAVKLDLLSPQAKPAPSVDAKIEQQQSSPEMDPLPPATSVLIPSGNKTQIAKEELGVPKVIGSINGIETTSTSIPSTNITKLNETMAEPHDKIDLSGPGVVKRGVIVFGGFALLAVAYFIFYRRKSKKNDPSNTHNAIDANQFRYGVLQSEDRRDNMELSRVPLTMESDDDEDDDLEIFDIEQKKKSLSYVNLQVNDEEIVKGHREDTRDNERDNLLLDIEDANTDALINWSNNGNKSIL